jgi:rod shape-determining protein MreC
VSTLAVRRQTGYLLLALSLGHILLISAQVQSGSGMPVAQSVAFGAFARVQQILAAVADGTRSTWTHYFALRGVVRENEGLKQQVLQLEGQLQQAQARATQLQSLERALGLRQSLAARTLTARVIAGGPSPGSLTVTIDLGSDDGVQPDMAVIGMNGVVGRVINRPLPHVAQVQLLVDRAAGAAVYFERSGVGAFVRGVSGDPPLRMELVPAAATINVGDRVLTSGLDGIYPRGFPIGAVEHAERRAGVWTVAVRPAVDFSHIDIVLIVLDKTGGAK